MTDGPSPRRGERAKMGSAFRAALRRRRPSPSAAPPRTPFGSRSSRGRMPGNASRPRARRRGSLSGGAPGSRGRARVEAGTVRMPSRSVEGASPAPRRSLEPLNVAMWIRALQIIPRITPAEWRKLDLVSRWLIASRGAVLVVTFISVGIAGLLAIRDGGFDLATWSLVAAGLLLAHATNNLINDLTDHARGVDRDNYFRAPYGPPSLEHGLMK